MTRKPNPQKDDVRSSASAAAAAARTRRTPSAPRAPLARATAQSPEPPARGPEVTHETAFVAEQALAHEDIARLAYSLWEARGRQTGNPEEDWLRAEAELRQRTLASRR